MEAMALLKIKYTCANMVPLPNVIYGLCVTFYTYGNVTKHSFLIENNLHVTGRNFVFLRVAYLGCTHLQFYLPMLLLGSSYMKKILI